MFGVRRAPAVTKPGITISTMSVAPAGVKPKPPLVRASSVAHTTDDTAMHFSWEADLSPGAVLPVACFTGMSLEVLGQSQASVSHVSPSAGFLAVRQPVMSQVCRELDEASATVLGYIREAEDLWTTGPR